MDFDDLFENKRKHHGNYRKHAYHDERYAQQSHHSKYGDHQKWLNVLEKIKNSKKLKVLIIGAVILILALAIGLILLLWPIVIKLFNFLSQNGLQGILELIWKGSGE